MDKQGAAHDFSKLPAAEQARYRKAGQQMVRLARDYAVPIFFGPPPRIGGEFNGATACVLEHNSNRFVLTASHVLKGYEARLRRGEAVIWQVGKLPFDPLPRIAFRDCAKDIVILGLSQEEANRVGSLIASDTSQWPPQAPKINEIVIVSGYPKMLREIGGDRSIDAGAFSAMFRVTTTGDGYLVCQIEEGDLVSFNEDPLPEPDMDIGGLSGGPALLMKTISYPVVGVVTDYSMDFKLLRIATLENIPLD